MSNSSCYCYRTHGDHLYFPTRRSSDLAHDQRSRYRCVAPLDAPHGLGCVAEYRRLREITDARSEEHTSELQSRPQLVCRLLLEKKNPYKLRIQHQYSYLATDAYTYLLF